MAESQKHDAGKLPLHLIDPLWLETTSQVLDFGAKKYAEWNWAQGTFKWSRLYSALQRHLNAFWAGEETDPESGLPHLWHANCCIMFLTRYHASQLGTDDRFKGFPNASVPVEIPAEVMRQLLVQTEAAPEARFQGELRAKVGFIPDGVTDDQG